MNQKSGKYSKRRPKTKQIGSSGKPMNGQESTAKNTNTSGPEEPLVWTILKTVKPLKTLQEQLEDDLAEALREEIDKEIIESIKQAAKGLPANPGLAGFSLQRTKIKERK